MKKLNIPNSELEDSVAEPKDEVFMSRLEIDEPDLEKITGAGISICSAVILN